MFQNRQISCIEAPLTHRAWVRVGKSAVPEIVSPEFSQDFLQLVQVEYCKYIDVKKRIDKKVSFSLKLREILVSSIPFY